MKSMHRFSGKHGRHDARFRFPGDHLYTRRSANFLARGKEIILHLDGRAQCLAHCTRHFRPRRRTLVEHLEPHTLTSVTLAKGAIF